MTDVVSNDNVRVLIEYLRDEAQHTEMAAIVGDDITESYGRQCRLAAGYLDGLLAERKALRDENARLRKATQYGVELIRGEATGKEWKLGCKTFLDLARAAWKGGDT